VRRKTSDRFNGVLAQLSSTPGTDPTGPVFSGGLGPEEGQLRDLEPACCAVVPCCSVVPGPCAPQAAASLAPSGWGHELTQPLDPLLAATPLRRVDQDQCAQRIGDIRRDGAEFGHPRCHRSAWPQA
jgi:hypothetical protein